MAEAVGFEPTDQFHGKSLTTQAQFPAERKFGIISAIFRGFGLKFTLNFILMIMNSYNIINKSIKDFLISVDK